MQLKNIMYQLMQMTSTVIWSMPDKNFEILLLSTLMHIKSKFTLVHTKGEVHTNSKSSSSKPTALVPAQHHMRLSEIIL